MINLSNFEENTLFIIGNGFDAAHGIKSSYWDFHNWLLENRYWEDVSYLERLFPLSDGNIHLLWKDFEEALGQYDADEIHNEFFQGVDNGQLNKDVQERVTERIKPFINRIPKYMKEWAENIKGLNYNKVFDGLNGKYKYLTFNYTLVLEKNYLIPPNHICHIHGSIKDEKIIVGHNHKKDLTYEYNYNTNTELSKRNITELMNTNVKPVNELISKNINFFSSLYDVTKIVVVGHSLSKVDIPYFIEVANRVNPNSIWHFCWHTAKDEELVNKLTWEDPFCRFINRKHKR
jgi:hypothetical protein